VSRTHGNLGDGHHSSYSLKHEGLLPLPRQGLSENSNVTSAGLLGGSGPEDGQGVQPRFFCGCDEVGGSVEDHGLGCVELEGVRRRGDEGGRGREREGEKGRLRRRWPGGQGVPLRFFEVRDRAVWRIPDWAVGRSQKEGGREGRGGRRKRE
jgi:hypothetical protein